MTGIPASEFSSSSGQLPAPLFVQFDQISRSMLTGTTQFNASVQALNKEWAEFIGKRLQEEAQLFHALGECKTLSDAQTAYARFWKNAFSQYSEEAQRVMQIAQSTRIVNRSAKADLLDGRQSDDGPKLSRPPKAETKRPVRTRNKSRR